uniref:non-specific serine/threonine protein kinase n=1 Tax=Caenorhabditis tropicalis TaxID=1561998 RepID=A0A1I7TDQ8_9PELO
MPPKKKDKIPLSEPQKLRTAFNRGRALSTANVIEYGAKFPLFASFDQKPEPNFKKAKVAKAAKKVFFESPNVSDVHVSSDEEDAGQFKIPDAAEDEAEKIKKMNADFDLSDVSSFAIFNKDGEQVDIVNGKHVIRSEQPPPEWRPGVHEELIGNYLPMKELAKIAKKKDKEVPKKKMPVEKPAPKPMPPPTFHQSLCVTIRAFETKQSRRAVMQERMIRESFRVFNTPRRNAISRQSSVRLQPAVSENKDSSIIGNTPNRDKSFERNLEDLTFTDFAPKTDMVSTPIENRHQNKIKRSFPIFVNSSDDECEKPVEVQKNDKTEPVQSNEKTILNGSGAVKNQSTLRNLESADNKSENYEDNVFNPTMEIEEEVQEHQSEPVVTTVMNRKAETSVSELLGTAENEKIAEETPENSNYSKKRQRTKSPETMGQEMSTVMTMRNDENEVDFTAVEVEKENIVKKRGTLQPQQRQLDKESRLSRLSVVSTASSCQESINSAMNEISLDILSLDEETIGNELGKTYASESRAESRNAPTGMTIHNEDDSILPFYLEDGSFVEVPSTLNQLLHVTGQTEIQTWGSLPKSAFDGRRVKKLGEGSYGEVFSTIWEGRPVAIKVVPFEEDKDNRLYHGEYHSGEMQTADQLLPELIVLKELNKLNSVELETSTPNFIEMVAAKVVKGNYPKGLLTAWDNYVKESENTRPNVYSSKDQLFCILVSANGGIALEDFRLQNENEIFSILLQLILSMVAAEAVLEFEHRDLHLGNVLIDRSGIQELKYKIADHAINLKSCGVQVNIIDFTLSRISKEGTTVYLDLEQDPGIFEGQGDSQFDVYREMRANCKGKWREFNNRTNLMWIIFIAQRLLEPDICPEGLLTKKRIKELRQFITELGTHRSCGESFLDKAFYEKFYQNYFVAVAKPQESAD